MSQQNEAVIQRVLYNDICRRIGGDLNEKQANRLIKTVKHYMTEVYRVKGGRETTSSLNKEVLRIVLPDYMMYMERSARSSSRSVMSDMEEGPPPSNPYQKSLALEDVGGSSGRREQLDVGTAFSQLQAARQAANKPQMPEIQDFRLSLKEEGTVSLDVFERIKSEREAEARRVAAATAAAAASTSAAKGQQAYATASDQFVRERRRAEEEAEDAFAELERRQLEARVAAQQESQAAMPVPPDLRSLLLGNRDSLDRTMNRAAAPAAAGNPTTIPQEPVPNGMQPTTQQQLIITREPSLMEYKENELNLFVYSGDRDWISNSSETRYNFTVNFDPTNLPTGLRLSPTSTVKFRNITRIELVKAILPGENIDNFVTRSYNGGFTYSAPYNINILSFPYIQVRIPELDNANYGTNLTLNAAFGVLQYDANWISDTANNNARGFLAMVPKFLKCQKTYTPTPLATIQKLTFRFERPDGTLVSTIPDTLDIAQIFSSKEIAATNSLPYGYDSAVETGTSAAYYFIKTSTFFNNLTVTVGDRILVKNLTWSAAPAGSAINQVQDFLTFITGDAGLLVVDVGYTAAGDPFSNIAIGANKQGYCNYIVVRGKFTDPTLGGTATATLGNLADTSSPGSLTANTLSAFLSGTTLSTGRLLNQSHQVQVSLRVITREMDSTSVIRPDNL